MAKITVAVCVATYRRPDDLYRLLKSLEGLELGENGGIDVKLAIADNDSEGSAWRAVERARGEGFPFPVFYGVEPKQGKAEARNLSVKLAGEADYVAFIDDDETVDPAWLGELVRVAREYGAQIVAGPVLPIFEKKPEEWMIESGLFSPPVFETGYSPRWAGTGNLLVEKKLLDMLEGPFNPSFSLTGGEDDNVFRRLKKLGAKNVYAKEAVTWEFKPADRMTARWAFKRKFRRGTAWTAVERSAAPALIWPLRPAIFGAGLIARGALTSIPGLVMGKGALMRAIGMIVFGAGMIAGISGFWVGEFWVDKRR